MAENLVHSHERDGRSWKGEWAILPDATLAAGKSLTLLKLLLKDLQIHPQRMRANILATNGFVHAEAVMLALAPKIGKQSAHRLVYEVAMQAQNEEMHFKQALIRHRQTASLLNNDEIEALFDPEQSTGVCGEMVDRVINRLLRL
jgi:adenylosuccinate lyase